MVDNKCLYHQMLRMRNRGDKLVAQLKKAKMEKDIESLFRKKDTVYLKNIIFIQSAGIAVFVLSYIAKFFGY